MRFAINVYPEIMILTLFSDVLFIVDIYLDIQMMYITIKKTIKNCLKNLNFIFFNVMTIIHCTIRRQGFSREIKTDLCTVNNMEPIPERKQ